MVGQEFVNNHFINIMGIDSVDALQADWPTPADIGFLSATELDQRVF